MPWRDLDLEEAKARSIRGDHPDEQQSSSPVPESTPTVRARLVQGLKIEDAASKDGGGSAVVDGGSHFTFTIRQQARKLKIMHLVGRRRVLIRGIGKYAVCFWWEQR